MSTEEKKLDDIHEICTALNALPGFNIQKLLLRALENNDYELNKFNSCLEKFICEYASTNNLVPELLKTVSSVPDLPFRENCENIRESLRLLIDRIRSRFHIISDEWAMSRVHELQIIETLFYKLQADAKKSDFIRITGAVVNRTTDIPTEIHIHKEDFPTFRKAVEYLEFEDVCFISDDAVSISDVICKVRDF